MDSREETRRAAHMMDLNNLAKVVERFVRIGELAKESRTEEKRGNNDRHRIKRLTRIAGVTGGMTGMPEALRNLMREMEIVHVNGSFLNEEAERRLNAICEDMYNIYQVVSDGGYHEQVDNSVVNGIASHRGLTDAFVKLVKVILPHLGKLIADLEEMGASAPAQRRMEGLYDLKLNILSYFDENSPFVDDEADEHGEGIF